MTAEIISTESRDSELMACVYTAAEAAEKLGVSETTIRRAVRNLGVKKITGSSVAGFIRFDRHPIPVILPYYA